MNKKLDVSQVFTVVFFAICVFASIGAWKIDVELGYNLSSFIWLPNTLFIGWKILSSINPSATGIKAAIQVIKFLLVLLLLPTWIWLTLEQYSYMNVINLGGVIFFYTNLFLYLRSVKFFREEN